MASLLAGDQAVITGVIETSGRIRQKLSAPMNAIGERTSLNLGHTVGHAIEAATRYRTWCMAKRLRGE